MKKGTDYLAMLTDEQREKFIANFNRDRINYKDSVKLNDYLDRSYTNFGQFITCGFVFGETPEGAEYWYKIRASSPDNVDYRFNLEEFFATLILDIEKDEKASDEADRLLNELNIVKTKNKMTKIKLDVNPFICRIDVSAKINKVEERDVVTYNPFDYETKYHIALGERVFILQLFYDDVLSATIIDEEDDTHQYITLKILR